MSQRFFKWIKKYEILVAIIVTLMSLLFFWNVRFFINNITIFFLFLAVMAIISLLCLYNEKSKKSYIWHDSWLYTLKLIILIILALTIIYLIVSSNTTEANPKTSLESSIANVILPIIKL